MIALWWCSGHCMLRFPLGPDENLKVVLNKVNKVLGDKCRFQSKK